MRSTWLLLGIIGSLLGGNVAQEDVTENFCKWKKYVGEHKSGSSEQLYVADLIECVTVCRSRSQCQGFDYDYNDIANPTCWIHTLTDGTGLSKMDNVDHYVLVSCDAVITGCLAATFKTSGDTGPIDNNAGSQTLIPETTSIDDCKQQCLRIPTCKAFSFYAGSTNACFVYKDTSYETETTTKQGYTLESIITRCPTAECPTNTIAPYFTTFANQASSPGVASTSRTSDDCKTDCIYEATCVAVDIFLSATPSDTYCWLQLDQANLDDRTRQTFGSEQLMSQDIMTRCPTEEKVPPTCYEPTWDIKRNYHSTPALDFSQITTMEDCYSQCAATEYCVGVDIDTNPGVTLCWIYNSLTYFQDNGVFKAGVLHAELVDRCPSEPAENATDCLDPTWYVPLSGTGHYPGYALPNVITLDACMNECILDDSCMAIDVDNSGLANNEALCYLLYEINNEYSNPNVDFYKIDQRCPTSIMNCGDPIYEEFPNTRSFYGQPQNATSVDDCKKLCAESARADPSTCVKVDYDEAEPAPCYFHTEDSDKQSITGINQYLLKDPCPGENDTTTESTSTQVTDASTDATTSAAGECGAPIYEKVPKTRSFGGVQQDATTVADCKETCATLALQSPPACVKFDFEADLPKPCYTLSDDGETQEIDNIDQYLLIDACPKVTTASTTAPTTEGPTVDPGIWNYLNQGDMKPGGYGWCKIDFGETLGKRCILSATDTFSR